MTIDINSITLPKWPALIVSGDSVTSDQATEILFRTCSPHLSSNDNQWLDDLGDILGYEGPPTPYGLPSEVIENAFNCLPLNYLHNSRISSTYIGGLHGWCNWDGTIKTNGTNIGKWPSAAEVLHDLAHIAAAFPYLNMTVSLMNCESFGPSDSTDPVIELIRYYVKDGKVSWIVPEPVDARHLILTETDIAVIISSWATTISQTLTREHLTLDEFSARFKRFVELS